MKATVTVLVALVLAAPVRAAETDLLFPDGDPFARLRLTVSDNESPEVAWWRQQDAIAKDRRSQVGTGERSEKIRTYNFPQNRVTDHRINMTVYQLDAVMNGEIDEFIEALAQSERLQALGAGSEE